MLTIMHENIRFHLESHKTEGRDWPPHATHALVIRTKAWPLGFGERDVVFFPNLMQALRRLATLRQWGRLEGNYYQVDLYKWDLGPVFVKHYSN